MDRSCYFFYVLVFFDETLLFCVYFGISVFKDLNPGCWL